MNDNPPTIDPVELPDVTDPEPHPAWVDPPGPSRLEELRDAA